MPGTGPGPGDEAVNKAGPVPKARKTDKQVITIRCDEADSPGPQAAELSGGETGLGEPEDSSSASMLWLLDSESCECIAYPLNE